MSLVKSIVTVISTVSTAKGIIKDVGGTIDTIQSASKVADSLKGLSASQTNLALSSLKLDQATKANIISMLELEGAEGGLIGSTGGLSGAFTTLAGALGVSVGALTAIVAAVAAVAAGVGVAIYKTNQANEELRKSAQKLGNEFTESKKDIADYKTQIESLYETINSETASTDERREAREKLLSIQNEMLGKYGEEASSIDMITRAINGEIDALDRLTEKQWQKTKREFNQQDLKGWDSWNRATHGVDNNVDLMLKEMENREISIEFSATYDKETVEMLQKLYGGNIQMFDEATGFYTLTGNIDEIQDKLLSIQETSENLDLSGIFNSRLSAAIQSNDRILDSYEEFYGQLILQDRIYNSQFEDNYSSLTNAISEYNKLAASEDTEAKEKALQKIRDQYDALEEEVKNTYDLDNDEQKAIADSITNFFKGLSPEITVSLNKDKLKEALDNVFKDGKTGEEVLNENIGKFGSKEQLFNYGLKEHDKDDPLYDAYNTIKMIADDANISVQQLYENLEETGRLSNRLANEGIRTSYREHHPKVTGHALGNQASQFESVASRLDTENQDTIGVWSDQNWKKYDSYFNQYKKAGLDTQVAIQAAIVATNNAFKEQANAISEEAEEIESWNLDTALEKFNIDKTAFESYIADFRELGNAAGASKEALEQAAVAHYAFDTAINDLRSNLESYEANLTSLDRGCIEFGQSARSLADDLTAIIGVDFTLDQAESFIRSAENADLLRQAIDGSNEALMRLRANAVEDTFISVNVELNTDEFNSQFDELVNFIAANPDIGKFEAEAFLDNSPFVQNCIELVNQGKMTAEQLKQIFASLGWNIDFDERIEKIKLPKIKLKGQSGYNASKYGGKAGYTSEWDGSYVDVPVKLIDNIRFNDKRVVSAPKSTGSGKSGGGGGGGGGSKDHTPTEHTPNEERTDTDKKIDEAADAAKKLFDEERAEKEKELDIHYIDWIERLLDKLASTVKKWTDAANDFFTFWNKNLALNRAIMASHEELVAQQKAAKIYEGHAKTAAQKAGRSLKVDEENMTFEIVDDNPLSQAYINKIKMGAMQIETLNGKQTALQKKIEEYITWYNTCHLTEQSVSKKLSNCWEPLKTVKPQHKDEIDLSVMVKKLTVYVGNQQLSRE